MRIYEFDSRNAQIVSLLSHLKKRAETRGKESAKVHTRSFLAMAKNIGINLSVNSLNAMLDKDQSIGSLISNADNEFITLNMMGELPQDDLMGGDGGGDLDLGLDDEGGDLDLGLDDEGGEEEVGATTDDFEDPALAGPVQKTNQVDSMAKRALSRRV